MKMFAKKFKEKFSIGLDIGTHTIKIAKLKFAKDAIELGGFELESTQVNPADTLKNLAKSQGIETVNIGVSGPQSVIRYITFPRMNEDELRQSLRFEAQKHIPFSISEINLDGYILKEDLPDNKMLVLLAAVKKELINQRLKSIEDAGIKVNIVDIDSLALINAFNFNYSQDDFLKQKAIALLNIGASLTNLNILENGIPSLSRDMHLAGNNFTQKLVDAFGMDFKSAEDLKNNPDSERANKVKQAIESVLTNLAGEIRISFDYFESQSTTSVAKIFLSGGSCKSLGLKEMLANSLGIEVEYWDPLKLINVSSKIDPEKAKAYSGQLAVALGLALRH